MGTICPVVARWSSGLFAAVAVSIVVIGGLSLLPAASATSSCASIGEVAGNLYFNVQFGHNATDIWTVVNYCPNTIKVELQPPEFNPIPNATTPTFSIHPSTFSIAGYSDGYVPLKVTMPKEPGFGELNWGQRLAGLAVVITCSGGVCIEPGVAKIVFLEGYNPKAPQPTDSMIPPSNGPAIFSGLKLSLHNDTPAKSRPGAFVAGLTFSPLNSTMLPISIAYSNLYATGSGTLHVAISTNRTYNYTKSIHDFRGSAYLNLTVPLRIGYSIVFANITLGNRVGTDIFLYGSGITINDTLSFFNATYSVSSSVTASYVNNASWEVTTSGVEVANGSLGPSASNFTNVALPMTLYPNSSVVVRNDLQLQTVSPGSFVLTVTVQIGGRTMTISKTFETPA